METKQYRETAEDAAIDKARAAAKLQKNSAYGDTKEINLYSLITALTERSARGKFIRYRQENGQFSQWYGPRDAIVDSLFYLEKMRWDIGEMPKSVWLTPDLALYTGGPKPGNAIEYKMVQT